MHGYKEDESAQARLRFSLVVGGVLVRYLIEHGDALAEHYGQWDEIVTVPSTRTPPPSALARVLTDRFSDLIQAPVEWLRPGPGEMRWVRAAEDGFLTTVNVEGARILLVDDTFTTGARMQSAAHALQSGGATVVFGMAVSRKIRVNVKYNTVELWARQSAEAFSFTTDPWWKV
jgi:orotate phosphoribosyltransferase-like protein